MNRLIIFVTVALIFIITSCKKELQSNGTTISGKWNVLTDSSFAGVGAGNHAVNYTGQPGDFFDFKSDGYLYIKEGSNTNKLSYTITSDTTIVIDSFGGVTLNGVSNTNFITNLTAHSVTITAPFFATPGGVFGRKVSLAR
jgi:hypothetical protein